MLGKLAAWSVHLFTASGLLAGFMGLLAAVERDYRAAMLWMLATLVIDGIDGTFARLARVREVLPKVDGKTIDYVIDFFTYCILPAYLWFVWSDGPPWAVYGGAFLMLLSGAIYYGLDGMVSEDGKHFVGFPVLWNMVMYVFIFVVPDLGWAWLFHLIVVFAVLHFVPILTPYPSRGGPGFWRILAAVIVFIGSAIWNVYAYPEVAKWGRYLALLSVGLLTYDTGLATVKAWRKHGAARAQVPGKDKG